MSLLFPFMFDERKLQQTSKPLYHVNRLHDSKSVDSINH